MKKILIIVLAALFLFTVSSWLYRQTVMRSASWEEVKRGPIVSAVYGLGTVTSSYIYHLKVGVTTRVDNIYVKEGEQVKEGQLLVQFNNLPPFKALFSGTVTSIPVFANETVYPQTEILTLMDLSNCYVLVSLEQEAAIKIQKGQNVKLSFSGVPDETFNGVVSSIYPKDQQFYVKIIVDKLPQSILPEMSSDVAIVLDKKTDALLVPVAAVKNSIITVQRDNKIKKIRVKLGVISDDYAEIVSNNINVGDKVLVSS
jgi:membrane fusion protein, macrolide-specific efflux system